MRKVWLLVCLLLIPCVSAVGADFYAVSVSPESLYPGETVVVNITLKNLGSEYAMYLKATLDPEDISPINPIDAAKKYLSRAEAAETTGEYFGIVRQTEEIKLQYKVHVNDSVSLGAYYVPLKLEWEDPQRAEKTQTIQLGIEIAGKPSLIIAGLNATPSRIYPDSEFTLFIAIENVGTSKAEGVEARLTFPEEFSGERDAFLGTIQKDGKSFIAYNLKSSKTAESKSYSFKLALRYMDEKGRNETIEKPFEIYVSKRGDINLQIAGVSTSPSRILPGTDFTLSVQLENVGTKEAKSVKAELVQQEGFTGEYSSFIGKIEEDDVSSGIFDMRTTKDVKPGSHDFVMKVTYSDESGAEYTEEKSFPIFVDEAPKSNPTAIAGVVIVVLLLAIYLWRRRKKETEI